MPSFIRDFIQGGAQAIPGAVNRANKFEQEARFLATREKANQISQQSVEELNKNREQQRKMNEVQMIVNTMKLPEKMQPIAFKKMVENEFLSQDAADLLLKMPQENREHLQKLVADEKVSMSDMIQFKDMGYESLIPFAVQLEKDRNALEEKKRTGASLTPTVRTEIIGETNPQVKAALGRVQQNKMKVAEAMSGIKAKFQEERARRELSRKAKPIQQAVSELSQMVDNVFTAEGLVSRALFTAEGKIANTVQFNETQENIILFNTLSEALVPPLARFLTNEKGPLTESDKAPARALMPVIGDNKSVARKKMDLVKRLLKAAAGGKAGKSTSKKTFDIGNRSIKDMSIEELVDLRQDR